MSLGLGWGTGAEGARGPAWTSRGREAAQAFVTGRASEPFAKDKGNDSFGNREPVSQDPEEC